MKKIFTVILVALAFAFSAKAATLSSLTWANVCSGGMGDDWYGTDEAMEVADIVLSVQKNNGGWMKNDQLHKLTASELNALQRSKGEHSCFDNYATTQEMRFLARVYQKTKVEKYRTAFQRAVNLIITAGKGLNGGWGQYWPLSTDKYSYQNYITFNDDLMTNMMKILADIAGNKGFFLDMVDENVREQCKAAYDNALQCVIKCQVDDNGTKAAWCAQHDPNDFLPTEGRPHELPSISGSESATLLSYLMTIEDPSKELQECITNAVEWLDKHRIEGKAIEDFTNSEGVKDRRIIDKEGSSIWGRFIQIGGESGKAIYQKFFKKLKDRGKSRSYTYNGKTYTYTEYEIATASYDETKAYQPIFAIYTNDYPHLFYRFLYNYADTEPVTDSKGLPVATSLMAGNRASYQYLGSWCENVIKVEYPAWKQKMDIKNSAGDATMYEMSQSTYESSPSAEKWNYANGFSISNSKGKGYAKGVNNAVKFSANVPFTINIPEGLKVVKVMFSGYSNYDSDAYISSFNGIDYSSTDYVFPAKDSAPVFVTHTFDISDNPATGTLPFAIGNKQCGIIITLYCMDSSTTGIRDVESGMKYESVKKIKIDNGITIRRSKGNCDVAGKRRK